VSDWLSSADPVIVTIPKRIRRTVGMNVVTIPDGRYIFFNSVSILQAAVISRKPDRSTLVVVAAVVVLAAAAAALAAVASAKW